MAKTKDRKRKLNIKYSKKRKNQLERKGIYKTDLVNDGLMKLYLDKIFPKAKKFDNKRYNWLNGVELDRFYSHLRLAFEYNGIQHYKRSFFINDVKRSRLKDKLKIEICKQYGIKLIIISCFLKVSKDFIIGKLSMKGNHLYNKK